MFARSHLRAFGFALGLAALAVGLVLFENPAPVAAQPGPKPASESPKKTSDLALIPANAGGFIHIEVAQVWKTDAMKDVRKIVERAGSKAFAALEEFKPAPSTLERVTVVLLPVKTPRPDDLKMVTILSFREPFVAADVRKQYLAKASEKKTEGKTYYSDEIQGVSVHFRGRSHARFRRRRNAPGVFEDAAEHRRAVERRGRRPRREGDVRFDQSPRNRLPRGSGRGNPGGYGGRCSKPNA